MKKISLLFLLFPLIIKAQTPDADSLFIHAMAVNILSSDASYNNLHYLTKNIGGRLSGSPQMYLAETWGAKTLKDAGADNVMLQQCMVPHWVRGGKDKAFVVYKAANGKQQKYQLNILALGNSAGSGPNGVSAALLR